LDGPASKTLNLTPYTQQVAFPELSDLFFRVSTFYKLKSHIEGENGSFPLPEEFVILARV